MIDAATKNKLHNLRTRYAEIGGLLSEPRVISDHNKFRKLSIELAELEPIVKVFAEFTNAEQQLAETSAMLDDADSEIRRLAQDELPAIEHKIAEIETTLQTLLLPTDRTDKRNVFLEIRAGTGGDEAALFAGDLFKMYYAYAINRGWQMEIISSSEGEHGGYKEIISKIDGGRVYANLKFESGAHRVQRVPQTESQGRIHTSACTVAVMPEADEMDEIEINPTEIRVDTFRASGAGGQHVNKTDSAIRITHLPSGLVVECQDQRSQHKNRARALAVLKARLLEMEIRAQQQQQANMRKSLVGTGDRSERIRTYNFPQGRVTDHRINLTLYKLETILAGHMDQIITPLIAYNQAALLAQPHSVDSN